MFKKYTDGKFFCFSPPVMLATFIIEFGLAFYTFWQYKINTAVRLAIGILLALGTFQLSEYMICGGLGLKHVDWARFGYIAITLLPALGIHLLATLAEKKKKWLINAAYATCTAFVIYFAANINSISGQTCNANYAVFYTDTFVSMLFGAYYYGWMLTGVILAIIWGKGDVKKRNSLYAMMLGYLSFILPTTFFNIVDPTTIHGIPSIMCGFAVLLALIISIKVLPNSAEVYKKSESLARD